MNDNLKDEMFDYIKKMSDGESDSIKNIYDKFCKNKIEKIDLFKLQEEIENECEKYGIILDYSKYDSAIVGLPYDISFVKISNINNIDKDVNKMEEFKINNNVSFEDEETKIEYQKYLDKINEYNKKIANGETPEKDLSSIMDEFKGKFIVRPQNGEPQVKSTNDLDDLIKKIDDKLNIHSENKSIDEQIKDIDDRIADLEKIENDSTNFIPDSLKDFISFDSEGYVFPNQKLPVELEIEYDNFTHNYYNSEENKIVNSIVNKIVELPYNVETTIAQLINYNPKEGFVGPLTQGVISNAVEKKCKNNNINIIEIRDGFGGLAYNYKIKKVINESKDDGTPYAKEYDKIYENTTQEEK